MRTPEEIAEELYARQDAEAEARERKARAHTLIPEESTEEDFVVAFDRALKVPTRDSYTVKPIVLETQLVLTVYGSDGEDRRSYVVPRDARYGRYREVGGSKQQVEFWWNEAELNYRLIFERNGDGYRCVARHGFNQSRRSMRRFSRSTHTLRLG